MYNYKVGLDAAETVNQFLAEESSYLHVLQRIEWRIEMAGVVSHLHQIYNIYDMLLAYTHKCVVESQKYIAVYGFLLFFALNVKCWRLYPAYSLVGSVS